MAKGQKRSSREIRKPKAKKADAVAPALPARNFPTSAGILKKKP